MSHILIIAPHPDDESIGCGGAACAHAARGDRVSAVFLTSGEKGLSHLAVEEAWRVREHEAGMAAEVLGIGSLDFLRRPDWFVGQDIAGASAALRPVLEREDPQRIYLPHPGEWHPDHQAALPTLSRALRDSGLAVSEVLVYEVWTPLADHDCVEDVTAFMARKLRAVRCHTSQLAGFRYDRAALGLNAYRGALAGRCRFAEVFKWMTPGAPAEAEILSRRAGG